LETLGERKFLFLRGANRNVFLVLAVDADAANDLVLVDADVLDGNVFEEAFDGIVEEALDLSNERGEVLDAFNPFEALDLSCEAFMLSNELDLEEAALD
jgi:hypothetical protein